MARRPFVVWCFWVVILGSYLATIIFVASRHEIWRDEMRALSIVKASPTVFSLVTHLKNEGHPILWYLFLTLGHRLYPSPLILQIMNGLLAFAGVSLFLRSAPFSLLEKVLFIFGALPLYEYGVIARNYSLAMCSLFVVLICYPKRFSSPLSWGIALFLLAQCSAGAWILAFAFMLSWGVELVLRAQSKELGVVRAFFGPILLILLGLGFSAWQCLPDETALATGIQHRSFRDCIDGIWTAIFTYGGSMRGFFTERFCFPSQIAFLGLTLLFWRQVPLLVFLGFSVVAFEFFHTSVYPMYFRHWGLLYLAIVALFWMQRIHHEPGSQKRAWSWPATLGVRGFWVLILILQVDLGIAMVRREVKTQFSASKAAAQWIKKQPQFRDAILLAEPDLLIESLPFYLQNRIFMVREGVFKDYVSLTEKTRRNLDFPSLMESAQHLRRRYQVPILFFYGYPEGKVGLFDSGFNRMWWMDRKGRQESRRCAKPLRSWKYTSPRESYSLYQLEC